MKSGELCLLKGKTNLKVILGVTIIKNKFINGDFIDENWILLAQRKNVFEKHEVLYEKVEQNLIKFISIKSFNNKNNQLISTIYKINEEMNYDLSWLEILQVAALSLNSKNTDKSYLLKQIEKLFNFYNLVIDDKTF